VLTVVNLAPDRARTGTLHLDLADLWLDPGRPYDVEDLVTGDVERWTGDTTLIRIDPAVRPALILHIREQR
jgi:starch synthase (maltosyl-transferring)